MSSPIGSIGRSWPSRSPPSLRRWDDNRSGRDPGECAMTIGRFEASEAGDDEAEGPLDSPGGSDDTEFPPDAPGRSDDPVRQFVEHWGMMARSWGINATMGE